MLLAVLTCQSATDTAKRHWPSWQKHFKDIVFVTTVDSNCWVPEGVDQWQIGRDYYPDRDNPDDNLPRRTISVLEWFLKRRQADSDRLVLIEYDVVIFDTPTLKHEFSATMFDEFVHPPWAFSRKCAQKFCQTGTTLLRHKIISGGWPDRHLRLINDLVQPTTDLSINYSKNTLDQPWMIEEARSRIKMGCWAIHGCKTQEQFDALTA